MEQHAAIIQYKRTRKKCVAIGILLCAALLLLLTVSVGMGAMEVPPFDVAGILWSKLTGNELLLSGYAPNAIAVVWEIRLPRILTGIAVGAGLSAAGVMFQAILQNPLADPYTLGISTGAAFGASIAIYLNIAMGLLLPVPLFALLSALVTLGLVIWISYRGGGFVSANLIIGGIIVSSILSAGISFLKMLAGENVSAIVYWIMGSLNAKSWGDFLLVFPVTLFAILLGWLFSGDLNIMTLGSRDAEALGVNAKRTRLFFLLLASAITAVCVSACGVIGFVGLIVPHLLRFSVTSDNRQLLPLSALCGGLLLSAADHVTRLISNGEIPVGVLTTLLGGPFFLFLFLHKRKAEPNG